MDAVKNIVLKRRKSPGGGSIFQCEVKNPLTDKYEMALWIDDHFGHGQHGVKFPDGTI